jgi:glucose-6-phosphate isomerase
MFISLGNNIQTDAQPRLELVVKNSIASKIFSKDSSLWGAEAKEEASIRLGWTDPIDTAGELVPQILKLRDELSSTGVNRVVLCGMGGSSLAPEVICKSEGVELTVLDSTSPTTVRDALQDLEKTAVVVSSKSGSTVETDSQKRIFEQEFQKAGIDPGSRIIIVTDPGSPLMLDSQKKGYTIFEADPNVGGRYSALTAFGLVPSGLAGANIAKLVSEAKTILPELASDSSDNPAMVLAASISGERSRLLIDDRMSNHQGFADWAEQLIAESTGKEGKGILPVAGDHSAEIAAQARDILPVNFANGEAGDEFVNINGSLGELFMVFETATAAAGWLIGINPFDQPDVESAKKAARESLDSSTNQSFGEIQMAKELITNIPAHGYLSVQLYANRQETPSVEKLRKKLVEISKVPVTIGWGPRFLHSTGQFHKGGKPGGAFLQIVQKDQELDIPGKDFGFQRLIEAQAAGDAKVLSDKGNAVVRLEIEQGVDVIEFLEQIVG